MIKNGEKVTFKLIDPLGEEIISSSITKKSQISAYREYTVENSETTTSLTKATVECYCWGNEYISPAEIY